MPSYSKTYLLDAMENLGEATDCATNVLNLDIDAFWSAFIATDYAKAFQMGSPRVIAGLSGTEVALRIVEESGIGDAARPNDAPYVMRQEQNDGFAGNQRNARCDLRQHLSSLPAECGLSPEYWCGWIAAYYQWFSARTFKDITYTLPMSDILRMYPTFHEESEDRFVEAAEKISSERKTQSNLQRQRQLMGYSQSQLAKISGVGLRAIQQYEQGAKDINNASVSKVVALARVLRCNVEDLLEPRASYEYALVEF